MLRVPGRCRCRGCRDTGHRPPPALTLCPREHGHSSEHTCKHTALSLHVTQARCVRPLHVTQARCVRPLPTCDRTCALVGLAESGVKHMLCGYQIERAGVSVSAACDTRRPLGDGSGDQTALRRPGGHAGVGRGRGKGSGQVVMFARGHGRHGDGPQAPLGVARCWLWAHGPG